MTAPPRNRRSAPRLLVTGFGRFPGAAVNPTALLTKSLARRRRPAFAGAHIVTHIFDTAYSAVDRDLPRLIAQHRPDAILMFGLAPRARQVRIETRARNIMAAAPDVTGQRPRTRTIATTGASHAASGLPLTRILAAFRSQGIRAATSRDAGSYLCNYLYWRTIEASREPHGPRPVVFIHIPPVAPRGRSRTRSLKAGFAALLRAAELTLIAILVASRPHA